MFPEDTSPALIVNSFGDRYFHDVNGSAFNKIGSEALYKAHFADRLGQEDMLYILLGTDSGLLPKFLQATELPKGSHYIFVELPEILERLSDVLPENQLDSRILLASPEQWIEQAKKAGLEHYAVQDQMTFFRSIGAEDLYMERYQDVGLQLQEEFEQLKWTVQAQLTCESFTIRQLENLSENRVSAICLKGAFQGNTAVILGGGPSLDATIPWLSENRNRLVLIAVSRIARRLIESNLIPDIIVSIDPKQTSFDISKEMLLLWENTLFVNQFHVSSKLLGQWRGRNVYTGPRFGWPTPLDEDQLVTRGPTVTNASIDLAVAMGFSTLLLTGVDLCFSKEGYTHAKGSDEHQTGPQLGQGSLWVETYAGWSAETTPDFNLAIKTIAMQADDAVVKKCRLYNLSETAAKVPGIEFCAPEKVDLPPLPVPVSEILESYLPEETSTVRTAHLDDMIPELDRAIMAFKEIKRLAEKALKTNDYFWGRRGKAKGNPKYRKELDQIEKKLNDTFPDFTPLLKRVDIKNFLKVAYSQHNQELNQDDVDELMQRYYTTYRNGATKMLGMVRSSRDRLLNRLEEENDAPDFKSMIAQWKKDGQPGRGLVWEVRHGSHSVPEDFISDFKNLELAFQAIIQDTQTLHMAEAKTKSALDPVCGKLNLMFKRRETDHLRHMLKGLEALEEPGAKVLLHLGSGFLAELSGDPDTALAEYQNVIDNLPEGSNDKLLENALLRIFSIALDQHNTENALLAAQCLSELSPAYLPCYADMHRLAGDKMSALDIYTDYLKKVQTDISAMLKLGRLYNELGVKEGARLMFESVLKMEAENKAARQLLSDLEKK